MQERALLPGEEVLGDGALAIAPGELCVAQALALQHVPGPRGSDNASIRIRGCAYIM